jgi:hypothetical protein
MNNDFNDTGVKLSRNIQRQPDFELDMDVDVFGKSMWKGASMSEMMAAMDRLVQFFAKSCERRTFSLT